MGLHEHKQSVNVVGVAHGVVLGLVLVVLFGGDEFKLVFIAIYLEFLANHEEVLDAWS